ncbi:hypothetical protein [Rhizobium rosettiformans]|uniref:hypothetical protein n=1 Tax=Rhizobium rosettiformans TaxID=1368430 RepID=UPI00285D72F0|nr:hypothetical protein [Rhizobium rosettiformans]MDR7029824.1 hypothetical protein [Rhizobium rosettiformans]MDR7063538.1 hypothetical protein [Rhizobium rosettiformans]
MIRFALLFVIFASASSNAWAYCYEPSESFSPPEGPSSYSKPSVPYCLSSYRFSGEHTCEQWEIDSYQRDVEEYVDKLQVYMNEAAEVARQAATFAEEVETYARCEAEEVLSQHK